MRASRSRILPVVVIGLALFALSCREQAPYPDGDFRALVLSDTHISSDEFKTERLQRLVRRINQGLFPGVEWLMITGDVVSNVYGDYTQEDPDISDNRLRRAVSVLKELHIPFYLAMGNHDHKIASFRDSDAPWPQEEILSMWHLWQTQSGFQPYYAFTHKGWKLIVLNSMGGRSLDRHFDDTQLSWLKSQLNDGLPVVLFFHHPVQTDHFRIWCKRKDLGSPKKDAQFYAILKSHQTQIKGIFVGHGHMFVKDVLYGTIPVYETDSFGEGSDDSYYVVGFDHRKQAIQVVQGGKIEKK